MLSLREKTANTDNCLSALLRIRELAIIYMIIKKFYDAIPGFFLTKEGGSCKFFEYLYYASKERSL